MYIYTPNMVLSFGFWYYNIVLMVMSDGGHVMIKQRSELLSLKFAHDGPLSLPHSICPQCTVIDAMHYLQDT
jgi:hypothetical protein